MSKRELLINEESPLLINEINVLDKEIQNSIEFPKIIWIEICKHLSPSQICKLSLLNKKIFGYINESNLLWKEKSNNLKDIVIKKKFGDEMDYYYFDPVEKMPYSLRNWNSIKLRYFFITYFSPSTACEEKKKFILSYCKAKNIKTIEKKTYDVLDRINFWNKYLGKKKKKKKKKKL